VYVVDARGTSGITSSARARTKQGNGAVTEPSLYQLIRQPAPIADRPFEIELLDPGVEAFVFTFG
jgi:hypothetical protein